jgi:hypothetical protein
MTERKLWGRHQNVESTSPPSALSRQQYLSIPQLRLLVQKTSSILSQFLMDTTSSTSWPAPALTIKESLKPLPFCFKVATDAYPSIHLVYAQSVPGPPKSMIGCHIWMVEDLDNPPASSYRSSNSTPLVDLHAFISGIGTYNPFAVPLKTMGQQAATSIL